MQTPLICDECKGADVIKIDDVRAGDGSETGDRWGDLSLTDGHYRCPKCDAAALRFGESYIDWD